MSVDIEEDRNAMGQAEELSDTPRDSVGEDASPSSQPDSSAFANPKLLRPVFETDFETVKREIEIKILLLPCIYGLQAVRKETKPSLHQLAYMRSQARDALKYAEETKTSEVLYDDLVARCQFYLAIVNSIIGPSQGDSPTEEPEYLFGEATMAGGYNESMWAQQWLDYLHAEGRADSKTASPKPKPGYLQRAISWVRNSPAKSNERSPTKEATKPPPGLGRLSQPSSPGSNGPETARPIFTPSTPQKGGHKDPSTPGTRESVSSRLSGLSNLNSPGGENLDFDMLSERSESAFGMRASFSKSDIFESPSPRKPPALKHRDSSLLQEAYSPKSSSSPSSSESPTARLSSKFSRMEETLPAPNTSGSPRKHARTKSLALNIFSRGVRTPDPQDEAERGSASAPSSRTTFDLKETQVREERRKTVAGMPAHAKDEDMMKLMEEGKASPVVERFGEK